jgi:two-component system, sensor histidine kinase and response regulator
MPHRVAAVVAWARHAAWQTSCPAIGWSPHPRTESPCTSDRGVPPVATSDPIATPVTRLRVLLAEDHPVNQQLVVRLLEKRGYEVLVAADGQEAVDAAQGQCFDVVLMDIQMPRLGGFEATAAIRQLERATGLRTPIIAMTAHAMRGDRERCLDAGMDEYLSKPLAAEALYEAIERVILPQASRGALSGATMLDRFDGDQDLLHEIAQLFLDDCPARRVALAAAIRDRDGQALEAAAHLCRGSISIFGAQAAVAAALSLELMGREHRWDDIDEAAATFGRELDRLEAALLELAQSRGAPR